MKVSRISSVCSRVKQSVSDSRIARAYKVYKYNCGDMVGDSFFSSFTDLFQGMSVRRTFLKLISIAEKQH